MSSTADHLARLREKVKPFPITFVTGGAGYIGSHTVLEILKAGSGVVVIDNLVNSHMESLLRVYHIYKHEHKRLGKDPAKLVPLLFCNVDLRNRSRVIHAFQLWQSENPDLRVLGMKLDVIDIAAKVEGASYKLRDYPLSTPPGSGNLVDQVPDIARGKIIAVVHFAALKAVGDSMSQPLQYYQNNVTGLLNLLDAMSMTKVTRMVFSSSAVVYGSGKEANIAEDSVQVGGKGVGSGLVTNPYGRTKWMAEEILNDCCIANPEFEVVSLRYFNPTGSHASGLIGEEPKGTPNNIVPVILQAYQRRRSRVYVYGSDYDTSDGTGVRDYIHVGDLASGHLAALRSMYVKQLAQGAGGRRFSMAPEGPVSPQNYRVYNLGTGQGYSVLDIIKAFASAADCEIPFAISDARPGDLGTVTASTNKAASELGWEAEFGIQDMCRDVYTFAMENPQGYERLRKLSTLAAQDPRALRRASVEVGMWKQEMNSHGAGDHQGSRSASKGSVWSDSSNELGDILEEFTNLSTNQDSYDKMIRRMSVMSNENTCPFFLRICCPTLTATSTAKLPAASAHVDLAPPCPRRSQLVRPPAAFSRQSSNRPTYHHRHPVGPAANTSTRVLGHCTASSRSPAVDMSPARHKRLGHRKSRNGCLRCKARRVKCDERRPCANCVRHGIECSLVSLPQSQSQSQSQTSGTSGASDIPLATEPSGYQLAPTAGHTAEPAVVRPKEEPATGECSWPVPPPPLIIAANSLIPVTGSRNGAWVVPKSEQALQGDHISADWMQSLLLMQHYCNHTYKTMSRPETEELWRDMVPKTACENMSRGRRADPSKKEFLMHGLLAISALHYGHMYPHKRSEYSVISARYQNLALRYFANRLSDINEGNCEAYFLLATFIFSLSLCHITHPQEPEKLCTPDNVCQAFILVQGVKGILDYRPMYEWKQRGPLSSLFLSYDIVASSPTSNHPFNLRLDKIWTLTRELPRSMDVINEQSSCTLALESLRNTYRVCTSTRADGNSVVWTWPITLPLLFIEQLRREHHVALIILAHFAALGRPYEPRDWLSQGWSRCIIDLVERVLDRRWHQWILWPKKSIYEKIDVGDMTVDEP